MSLPEIDHIKLSKTVMFVGDYFSMITTITLHEQFRLEGEDDDTFAVRLAGEFIKEHYGFDVAAVSTNSGVMEEDEELEL
jgi:hypothetical protein